MQYAVLVAGVVVLVAVADLRQIQKPESFLFTTALNLLRDRARSAQARHAALSVPAEEALLVCPAPQAERVLDGEQQMQVLEAALGELTEFGPQMRKLGS